jgi:hypothetical protein
VPRLASLLCLILACGPVHEAVADTELLPEPSLRLEATRYEPTAPDLHWDTWIGGGTGLVRLDRVTVYFEGHIETTAGNTRRAFDASQANYHLEPSVRMALSHERSVSLFYHHVSRHEIDTQKTAAVDWNILGVRASARIPGAPAKLTASIGHTTQASLIGYRWEFLGLLEGDILHTHWGAIYGIGRARGVTTQTSPAFPRSGFVDARLEGGIRLEKGERTAQIYVAYEHRNDVLVLEPGSKDRALFGLRLALRHATPDP